MKIRILFLVFIFSTAIGEAFAQSSTITNADLTKYKQLRLEAEADLRENYAKLGFASPEERELRNARSAKEAGEISARLRSERIERERIEAQTAANAQYASALARAIQPSTPQYFEPTYLGGFYYHRQRVRGARYFPHQQEGYFAGGQFWPTGPRTPLRPLLRLRR